LCDDLIRMVTENDPMKTAIEQALQTVVDSQVEGGVKEKVEKFLNELPDEDKKELQKSKDNAERSRMALNHNQSYFRPGEPRGLQDVARKGGIDLNQANMDLQIRRDGNGVPLPVAQQDLEGIKIDGLVPTILDIRPVTTLPMLSDAAIAEPAASRS